MNLDILTNEILVFIMESSGVTDPQDSIKKRDICNANILHIFTEVTHLCSLSPLPRKPNYFTLFDILGEYAEMVSRDADDDTDPGITLPPTKQETHPKMDILRIYTTYEGMHIISLLVLPCLIIHGFEIQLFTPRNH